VRRWLRLTGVRRWPLPSTRRQDYGGWLVGQIVAGLLELDAKAVVGMSG
jgi:hypothetical protein